MKIHRMGQNGRVVTTVECSKDLVSKKRKCERNALLGGAKLTTLQASPGTRRILSILRPNLREKSTSGTCAGRNQNFR
jgi:hypothetical protein